MPRQDVPYGGAICRLKERIAEIWDKLGEKLHSVNGVTGDAAGNVEIVSGDAAITISEDQVNHQIEIALDSSQLPAAAVSSVNGQTGAVALMADDIPSDNGDVQTDLDNLAGADITLQSNINAEALARQNADSALQTNINNISAGLPAAAAAAVAADPTIAQLVIDMNDKVDVTDVSTVETPNTIAKRNGSGRLVAADPASGATDKTLVTANWVSQTGAGRPNNLIHDGGNEDINGLKTMFGGLDDVNQHAALFLDAEIATLSDNSSKLSKLSFICRDGTTVAYIRFNNRITPGVRGLQLVIFNGSGVGTTINLGTVTI